MPGAPDRGHRGLAASPSEPLGKGAVRGLTAGSAGSAGSPKNICLPRADFKPEGTAGSPKKVLPSPRRFQARGLHGLSKNILPSPCRFQARGLQGPSKKYFALPASISSTRLHRLSPPKNFALPMPIFKPEGTGECMWNINWIYHTYKVKHTQAQRQAIVRSGRPGGCRAKCSDGAVIDT